MGAGAAGRQAGGELRPFAARFDARKEVGQSASTWSRESEGAVGRPRQGALGTRYDGPLPSVPSTGKARSRAVG